MKSRKFLAILLAVALAASMLAIPARAAEIVDSGECDKNLTWALDDEGTLTISGTGGNGVF